MKLDDCFKQIGTRMVVIKPETEEEVREETKKTKNHNWLFLCDEEAGKEVSGFLNWCSKHKDRVMVLDGEETVENFFGEDGSMQRLIATTLMDGEEVHYKELSSPNFDSVLGMCFSGMDLGKARELASSKLKEKENEAAAL